MALAVDLSTAAVRRRSLEARAETFAAPLRARAARLRRRAARAPLGSNERRKLTLRADGFEAEAERTIELARVA
jgi:hypothetical protein